MSFIGMLILLVIVAVALYLIPMDERIKKIIYVVVAIAVLIWLLSVFGLLPTAHIR